MVGLDVDDFRRVLFFSSLRLKRGIAVTDAGHALELYEHARQSQSRTDRLTGKPKAS